MSKQSNSLLRQDKGPHNVDTAVGVTHVKCPQPFGLSHSPMDSGTASPAGKLPEQDHNQPKNHNEPQLSVTAPVSACCPQWGYMVSPLHSAQSIL